MKKSSLGRRSSVMGIGRLSMAEKNISRLGENMGKSFIPKPCSTVKSKRASSVERDLNVSSYRRDPPSTLQRSKSYHNIDIQRTSTPCFTPQQNMRSKNAMYSKLQLSEGGSRSSSVGGLKSAKKDSRPVTEKSFQSTSQTKIQQFFMTRASHLLDKGSIKPMTTAMFVDLVNFLMTKFDHDIVVNKTNPIDGILLICKVLQYRGKAEKSWIRTVNTPHSWPHVVSFLVWLVELYEVSDALCHYEAMYPENDDEIDLNEIDFKIIVPHLLDGYEYFRKNLPDDEEMNKFLTKHKQALNIDERQIELLQEEYGQLQSELNNSEDATEEEQLAEKQQVLETLKRDIKNTREFNYETEQYVASMDSKHKAKTVTFKEHENRIRALNEDKAKLQQLVSLQEMSIAQKKEIETSIVLLQREIKQLNETIEEYKTEIYKEDLKLVSVKGTFNKHVQAYNKEIIINLGVMPDLKSVEIEDTSRLLADSPESGKPFQHIDDRLAALKVQLKTKRQEIETEIEKKKLQLQEKEDSLAEAQEKFEILKKENDKLENEVAHLRQQLQHDKEQTKKSLASIQDDIEREKKKMGLQEETELEKELAIAKEKKEELQKKYDDYVTRADEKLKKDTKYLDEMEAKLEEVTKRKMEERQRGIDKILKR